MDFHDVLTTRRSVRSFKPDAVPEDVLGRILNAARLAPSGSNRQPWKFIVVTGNEAKQALVPLCADQRFLATAPVVVVACGEDIRYDRGGYMGDCSMLVDVAIAVDHLTLAARAEGIGSCWIGSFDNAGLKELLQIPNDTQVVALTPLGYPEDETVFRSTEARKDLAGIVCRERYEYS